MKGLHEVFSMMLMLGLLTGCGSTGAPEHVATELTGEHLGHIAFASYEQPSLPGSEIRISIMEADGSGMHSLTRDGERAGMFSWSPDGQSIAYECLPSPGDWQICAARTDGSDVRNLTQGRVAGRSPAWAPDGQHIAFTCPVWLTHICTPDDRSELDPFLHLDWGVQERVDICVVDADGSNLWRLTQTEAYLEPIWSPDGQYVAFVSDRDGNREIYVMRADGSELRNLSQSDAFDEMPTWSPDGLHIAFVSDRGRTWSIYVVGADGSGLRKLLDTDGWANRPAWSPDGQHIAFFLGRGDFASDLYVVDADGSNLRFLSGSSADVSGNPLERPSWSRDSRTIAFAALRDGVADIVVVAVDGSGEWNLTRSNTPDFAPMWSP
jgi:Tol biopolymer transport system component